MSLSDLISADSASVFLRTSDFATAATHWPGGDSTLAETVTVIFDRDLEETAGSASEDRGKAIMRECVLEMEADVTVTVAEHHGRRSVFVIGGEQWEAIRIVGRDDGLQSVRCIRSEPISTVRGRV